MSEYDDIKVVDELAADIYRDKVVFGMSYMEVAKSRGLKASYVKMKYSSAKNILHHLEHVWVSDLSKRSQHALLAAGFTSKTSLKTALDNGTVKLEALPNIGPKSCVEILEWVIKT